MQADAPRTHAADGQRAQLSGKYAYNRKLQLDRFAATFQSTAVCELSKEHLDKFIGSLDEFLPRKSTATTTAPPSGNFCNGQSAKIISPRRTA